VAYRKVRIVLGLVAQNPTTKDLVVPSAAQVYLSNKTTVATIYSTPRDRADERARRPDRCHSWHRGS
jgi:hypothetical protein